MSKILKKSLAIIVVLTMMFCTIPFAASAQSYSGTCGDNLTWTLDAETGVLDITGTGAMTDWEIESPLWYSYRDSIKTVNIASGIITIGDFAFYYCDSLTSVTIPDSITTIGVGAFSNCYSLTSVAIPDSVTTIGERAFYYCTSLESITIPDSVTSIPVGAFQGCQLLTNVTIPNSVTTLGNSAFSNCDSLTNVTIPDSVITIGEFALYHCGSLTSITVDANNKNYSSDSYGVLFNKDKTTLIQYPIGNTRTNYTIPDSVTTISNYALCTCNNLTSVIIPDSVTTIGDYAFFGCTSLTSTTIPDSVTTIGESAFYGCFDLNDVNYTGNESQWKAITIGESNEYLLNANIHYNYNGSNVVDSGICGDNLTWTLYDNGELVISGTGEMDNWDSEHTAPWGSYSNDIKTVNIANGVTSIGSSSFSDCNSLTSITIPDGVTIIGNLAFFCCNNLVDVTLSDSVTTIGYAAFSDCNSLTSVTIPDGVTIIGDLAFFGCNNLVDVTLSNSVITIGRSAFAWTTSLASVTIPDSVTTIGEYAFYACDSLTSITVDANNKNYSSDSYGVLFNKDKTTLIQYPGGNTSTSYIVPDSVTTIGVVAFYDGRALEYIHIPTGVNEIGETLLDSDSSTYICSTTQDCYAKTYADENGIEFRVCKGHSTDEPVYIEKTSDNGIKVEYDSSYFENNDNIVLKAEVNNDGNFQGFGDKSKFSIKLYEIHLEDSDGNEIKYTGDNVEYKVSIPVPEEGKGCEKFLIIHWIIKNGKKTCEPLTGIVENGYIVFKTKSFSIFDICIFGFEQKSIELNYKDSASVAVTEDSALSVIYTSSNPKVVTVDENGNITTQGRGSATITCTVTDDFGNTVSDTCEVTVKFTFWQWIIYILFLGFLWY